MPLDPQTTKIKLSIQNRCNLIRMTPFFILSCYDVGIKLSKVVTLRQDSLAAHNVYRAKHGVPDLKLNNELNALAQVRVFWRQK